MKFRSLFAGLLLGAILLSVAACNGGAVTTSSTSPTLAPAANTQPAPTQAMNTQATTAPAATQVMSAQPTATTAAKATAAPAATADNAPPASGASALDLLINATRAQASAKSFRSTNVTTTEDGTTSTLIVEYAAPDRIHMTTTNATGPGSDMIIIKGQGTWQKRNGTWSKLPVDMGATAFAFLDPKAIDQLRSTINVGTLHLIGPELLGTTPTFVYQYDLVIPGGNPAGGDLKGTYKVWVGAVDHRVYKQEGDTDSFTKPGAKTHTVSTYEYDIDIQIQPPA
ncbi:MAG: hypothetical protein WCF84_03430 [Anaerolineae bacterium]